MAPSGLTLELAVTPNHRPGPLPESRSARHNRRYLMLMALTPVVFGIIYALVAFTGGLEEPEPVVNPVRTPSGYTGITDAYFGYAIPAKWTENSALSDSNGDFYYNGPGGWAAENESIQKTSPTPSTPVPESLQSYGTDNPSNYTMTGGHTINVPGTAFAWEVTLTRAGGFKAQAIDTWEPHSQTELWLMVHSSPSTDTTVLASLRGSAVD